MRRSAASRRATPDEKQYAALQEASRLAPLADAPAVLAIRDGSASLRFDLPLT